MAAKTDEKSAPDARIKFKVGEDEREILMTFGLLQTIANKVGDLERVFAIGADFALNELILSELLTLDDKGKPHSDKFDLHEHTANISANDVQNILIWVSEHLTDFFIGLLERNITKMEKQKITFQNLNKKAKDLINSVSGSNP